MLDNDLDEDEAAQIALLNNRRLQVAYEDLGVAQAEVVQAGLLRNPVFDGISPIPTVSDRLMTGLPSTTTYPLLLLPLLDRSRIRAGVLSAGRAEASAGVMSRAPTPLFVALRGVQDVRAAPPWVVRPGVEWAPFTESRAHRTAVSKNRSMGVFSHPLASGPNGELGLAFSCSIDASRSSRSASRNWRNVSSS